MLTHYRTFFSRAFTPLARGLLRVGIGPDIVTLVGTAGVCAGALVFYPRGQLFWGTIVIVAFVFSDTVDGVMARLSGHSSRWGAFLDSTLDRVGDAAVFGGLLIWYTRGGGSLLLACVALYDLVAGAVTSYSKARAESLGMTANVGIAERADRLVAILVAAGFAGLGVPYLLPIVLWLLAVASTVTVVQRSLAVRRQALAAPAGEADGGVAGHPAAVQSSEPSSPGGTTPADRTEP